MNGNSSKPSAQMLSQSNCETFTDGCINVHVIYYSMVLIYLSRSFQYAFPGNCWELFSFSRKTYGSYGWLQLNWIARERKQPRRDLNNCWKISASLKQFAFASLPYGSYLNVRRDHLMTLSAASINTVVWATGEVIGKSWSVSTMQRAQPTARCIC